MTNLDSLKSDLYKDLSDMGHPNLYDISNQIKVCSNFWEFQLLMEFNDLDTVFRDLVDKHFAQDWN